MDQGGVPEDQKGALEKGATIAFVDEVGSSLKPVVARTWARKGHTPTLRHTFNWSSLSIIGGITDDGRVFHHTHELSIRAVQVGLFLEHLRGHIAGPGGVILDRAGIHRAKAVKSFLEREPRLEVHHLPAYAPDCNPIEWLWAHIKRQLANLCPFSLRQLKREWRSALARVRVRPGLVQSFFRTSAIDGARASSGRIGKVEWSRTRGPAPSGA